MYIHGWLRSGGGTTQRAVIKFESSKVRPFGAELVGHGQPRNPGGGKVTFGARGIDAGKQ